MPKPVLQPTPASRRAQLLAAAGIAALALAAPAHAQAEEMAGLVAPDMSAMIAELPLGPDPLNPDPLNPDPLNPDPLDPLDPGPAEEPEDMDVVIDTSESGVVAHASGDLWLNANSITTTGGGEPGVDASSDHGSTYVFVSQIETGGDGSKGTEVYAHGKAVVNVGNVTTSGNGATGVDVYSLGFWEGDYTPWEPAPPLDPFGNDLGGGAPVGEGPTLIAGASVTGNTVITTGDNATGVKVHSAISYSFVDFAEVHTSGSNSNGIDVFADGTSEVQVDRVTTQGAGSAAIVNSGDQTGTFFGSVETGGEGAAGLVITNFRGGQTEGDSIVTAGDNATALTQFASLGGSIILVDEIITSGANSAGVDTYAYLNNYLDLGSVTTQGDGSAGVIMDSATWNYLRAESITTAGDNADAVVSNAEEHGIYVGSIATAGAASNGVVLTGGIYRTDVIGNSITTLGDGSAGVLADIGEGYLIVELDQLSTAGVAAHGFDLSTLGKVSLDVGDLSTAGAGAHAVRADVAGNFEAVFGSLSTAGADADAVVIFGGAGSDVEIAAGDIGVTGAGADAFVIETGGAVSLSFDALTVVDGVAATVLSNDDITVSGGNVTADFALDYGEAFSLYNTAGDIAVDLGDLTVRGGGNATGIRATAINGGITANLGNVDVIGGFTGDAVDFGAFDDISLTAESIAFSIDPDYDWPFDTFGDGAVVHSVMGDITIDIGSISLEGYRGDPNFEGSTGFGWAGKALGDGNANIRIGSIDAAGGYGVTLGNKLFGADKLAVVEIGRIHTDGRFGRGLTLRTILANFDVTVGSIETEGEEATGIEFDAADFGAQYGTFDLAIDAGSIKTSGDLSAAVAIDGMRHHMDVSVGSIETLGFMSTGLRAYLAQAASFSVGAASTSGDLADAIAIARLSKAELGEALEPLFVEAGTIATSGDSARGIRIVSEGADIVLTADSVTTTGGTYVPPVVEDPVFDEDPEGPGLPEDPGLPVGGEMVDDGGAPSLYGASHGIFIDAFGGNVTLAAGAVSTAGHGANGIDILATGNGTAIDITVGDALTTGLDADAIHVATDSDATVAIAIDGLVEAQQGTGVRISGLGDNSITVRSGGTLKGAEGQYALVVEDYDDSMPGDADDSPIGGDEGLPPPAGPLPGMTLLSHGGFAGTTVTVEAGGTFDGLFMLGASNDVFANDGLFIAGGTSDFGEGDDMFVNTGTVRVDGMADFAGLEIFENDGTIAFLDNGVEDVLDLSGSLFVAGADSTFLFDASGDGDRLVLGDVEGTSALRVVGLTPELDDEILFVEVTGNADGAVFTVEESTRDAGFLNWRLTEEAGLIGLALAPDREVIEPARAGVLVTGLWHQSAEAARDSLSLLRTLPGDGRWGVFGQAYDVEQERDATDFAISHDGTGYSFALTGEEQGTGLEAGIGTRFGMVHVGLVAGTGSRELRIRESGNMMDADMTNIGLVAGYDDGRLSADAMIKLDQGELEMDLASADFRDTLDVDAFGASLGVRYRMDMGRLYVMPEASVAYASASLDGFDVDGGSFALEDSDSLRARLGARAGARLGTGKATLNPYAGLFLVNESGGANDVVFTSGGDSIRVGDEEVGLFGQALGGVALTFDDSISLFAQGSFDFGEVEGVSLRGGLGVRF